MENISCNVCETFGRQSRLQICQLNLDEAVYICPLPECTYPLDETNFESLILKQKPSLIVESKKVRKRRHELVDNLESVKVQREDSLACCVERTVLRESNSCASQSVSNNTSHSNSKASLTMPMQVLTPAPASLSVLVPASLSMPSPVLTLPYVSSVSSHLAANMSVNTSSIVSVQSASVLVHSTSYTTTPLPSLPMLPVSALPVPGPTMPASPVLESSIPVPPVPEPSIPVPPVPELSIHVPPVPEPSSCSTLPVLSAATAASISRVNHLMFNGSLSSVTEDTPSLRCNGTSLTRNNRNNTLLTHTGAPLTHSNTQLSVQQMEYKQQSALTDKLFLHWPNEDALCWLDVTLAMFVHCATLRKVVASNILTDDSCIQRLLRDFDEAQVNFRRSCKLKRCHYLCDQGKKVMLETSVGQICVKTGGGARMSLDMTDRSVATVDMDDITGIMSDDEPGTTSIGRLAREALRLEDKAKQLLSDVRELLFDCLRPLINCKRGQTDSALLALSALLSLEQSVSQAVSVSYRFTLHCSCCGILEQDRVCKEVPTFLKLPDNFSMSNPCFLRPCFHCRAVDQLVQCSLDRLPDVFFCHFMDGINVSHVTEYEFVNEGRLFVVTGFVEYTTNPRHFVCHLRQRNGSDWMVYDDLRNPPISQFKAQLPHVVPPEVHIVVFENVGLQQQQQHQQQQQVPTAGTPVVKATVTAPSSITQVVKAAVVKTASCTSSALNVVSSRLAITTATTVTMATTATTTGGASATGATGGTGGDQVTVGGLLNADAIEDRLLRAREKFKLQQNVVKMSSLVRPVLPTAVVKHSMNCAAFEVKKELPSSHIYRQLKTGVNITTTSSSGSGTSNGTSSGTSSGNSSGNSVTSNGVSHSKSTNRVRCVQLKSGGNTYSTILDKLHRQRTTTTPSDVVVTNTFAGYVPKSKQQQQQTTESVSSSINTSRRQKVCFTLPPTDNSVMATVTMTTTNASSASLLVDNNGASGKSCTQIPVGINKSTNGNQNNIGNTGGCSVANGLVVAKSVNLNCARNKLTKEKLPTWNDLSTSLVDSVDESLLLSDDILCLYDELVTSGQLDSTALDAGTTGTTLDMELNAPITELTFDDDLSSLFDV